MSAPLNREAFLGILSAAAITGGCSGSGAIPAGRQTPFVLSRHSSILMLRRRSDGGVLVTADVSGATPLINGKAVPTAFSTVSQSATHRTVKAIGSSFLIHHDFERRGILVREPSSNLNFWTRQASSGLMTGAYSVGDAKMSSPVRLVGSWLYPPEYGPATSSKDRAKLDEGEYAGGDSGDPWPCDPIVDVGCESGYGGNPDDAPFQDISSYVDMGAIADLRLYPTPDPTLTGPPLRDCLQAISDSQTADMQFVSTALLAVVAGATTEFTGPLGLMAGVGLTIGAIAALRASQAANQKARQLCSGN